MVADVGIIFERAIIISIGFEIEHHYALCGLSHDELQPTTCNQTFKKFIQKGNINAQNMQRMCVKNIPCTHIGLVSDMHRTFVGHA